MNQLDAVEKLPHHEQLEFCYTRAKYRQGRKLTSVKAYTVNDESKYLIVTGVPAIKIMEELERLCLRCGSTDFLKLLPDYPQKSFEEAYLVKYKNIKSARFAKVKLDGKSFYGGVLHVFYAPELETVEETREKLADRRKSIAALTRYKLNASEVNRTKQLNNVQIHKAATKRYLSQLKEDVSHIYKKYFEDDKASKTVSPVNVNQTEKPIESSTRTISCNLLESTSNIHENYNLESISKSHETNVFSSSAAFYPQKVKLPKETAKPKSVVAPSSTRKKIKVFKNAKILSYASDTKN